MQVAGDRVDGFGQRVVLERLLDLDRLVGVEEAVHVGGHATNSGP
jgi:hypothetical protein